MVNRVTQRRADARACGSSSTVSTSDNQYIPIITLLPLTSHFSLEWTSNWILNAFEIIPNKMPQRWFGANSTFLHQCHSKYDGKEGIREDPYCFSRRHSITPIEVHATVDIELNETSFLTFQVRSCLHEMNRDISSFVVFSWMQIVV